MSSEQHKEFLKTYPDIKYPVWCVGGLYFTHSHKAKADAHANATGQVVEQVDKQAPAALPTAKTKGAKHISDTDGTE